MLIRAITIEREFGCGGSEIAAKLAELLGWKLWDHELTQEIARLTNSTPQAVEKREWRNDPAVYRVFKSFLREHSRGPYRQPIGWNCLMRPESPLSPSWRSITHFLAVRA
jgi:cytidylate kinase-like protein